MCSRRNLAPTSLFRHKENIFFCICISIVLKTITFFQKFLVTLFKGTGYITKKNKSNNHLPIFSGRNMPPQNTSCIPNLFFKAYICIVFSGHYLFSILYKFYNIVQICIKNLANPHHYIFIVKK